MVIDGQVRQSCSCLANEQLAKTGKNHIELTPMTKFPVVRDLFVDRQRMFDNLKKITGWVPIDGTHDLGPGPPPMALTLDHCNQSCCVLIITRRVSEALN